MKGFVFTLDALFSLTIAATGLSVLFYFMYTAPSPYFVQYSSSSSLLSSLASTKLGAISGIPLVGYISQQYSASNQTWPLPIGDEYNSGGNGDGPSSLTINYVVEAGANVINGTIVAGYGNVYFGAGNEIYAVNVSSGDVAWTSNAPYNSFFRSAPDINATLLYGGRLIYATQANVVALYADNGTMAWSSNVMYNSGVNEPSSTAAHVKMTQYNGKLILATYDYAKSSSSLLYSLYANNGTLVGAFPQSSQIAYMAVASGQLILLGNRIYLQTTIQNSTYGSTSIWSEVPACGNSFIGVSSFANTIAFGCKNKGELVNVDNSIILDNQFSQGVTGVSSHWGNIVFQSQSKITLENVTGAQKWQANIPAVYGTAPLNATPITSSSSIYSLWSNGYLIIQNLSNGVVTANTVIPYPGPINPYMSLAYGRLFTSRGQYLMSFGSCPSNPNDSVLSAVATMYVNGEGSCASYLLSKIDPNANFSVSFNGIQVPISIAQFNGQDGYINVPDSQQIDSTYNAITISAWVEFSAEPSQFQDIIRKASQFAITIPTAYHLKFVGPTFSSTPNDVPFTPTLNEWYYIAATWSSFTNTATIYVDGNAMGSFPTTGSIPTTTNPLGIGANGAGADPFDGYLSNVQIYNTSLSSGQIGTLYREGITGIPISYANLVGWWPLNGDTNSYAGNYAAGYPFNVAFNPTTYNSIAFQNSFSVTSQSVPLPILNYSTGKYNLYNVGVYSWR